MTKTGSNRLRYSNTIEPAPSRFTNEGKDYAAWAKRADANKPPRIGTRIHGMHDHCLDYSGTVTTHTPNGFTVEFSDGKTMDYGMSTQGDYWKTEKGTWK